MSICNCNCQRNCSLLAVIVSAVIGIVAAFLQITGVITVAPVFLWVAFGIAVVYLGIWAVIPRVSVRNYCCRGLTAALVGILGTILFSLVLLAVGITATSIVSAILVGLLVGFLALVFTGTACLIRCQADCDN